MNPTFRVVMILALMLLPAALIGCGTSAATNTVATRNALRLYNAGDYGAAQREAGRVHGSAEGETRSMAALIAGLASNELGQHETAKHWLTLAARSPDRAISGRAHAGLGLAAIAQQDYAAAVRNLDIAGRKLEGNEAARANFVAGEAHMMLGQVDAARRAYVLARATATDGELRSVLDSRLNVEVAYAVQLGAFSTMANAQRIVSAQAGRVRAMGLTEPRIERSTDAIGRTLYLVRVGEFARVEEAQAARVRLGTDAVVVRCLPSGGAAGAR